MLNFFLLLTFTVCFSSIQLANAQQWMMPQTQQFQPRESSQFQPDIQMPYQPIGMSCVDTAINCLENYQFCSQPYFESTMRRQCARTCGFCRDTPTLSVDSGRCRDVNLECQLWITRGFCDSVFYSEQMKRRYCALSCGYCRQPFRFQPDSLEEPVPREPFADDPTPRSRENTTHKSRKTTKPIFSSEEEFAVSTTPKSRRNEEDSSEQTNIKKGRKNEE